MQAEERHAACVGGGDQVQKSYELAERYGGEPTVWLTREDLRLHVSDHGGGDCGQLVYQHHARPQGGREKGEYAFVCWHVVDVAVSSIGP